MAATEATKVKETVNWFRHHLGFICSDDVYAGEKENLIGSFNRIDGGDTFVDHHVFFAINHHNAGLNHVSFEVQRLPSLQAVPSTLGVGSHRSAVSLHVPSLHWSPRAEQSREDPPQTPAVQVSLTVQNWPSSHVVPSASSGLEQMPVAGSQTPATWH